MDGQQGQGHHGQQQQQHTQQQLVSFARSISCVDDVHASPSQRSSALLLLGSASTHHHLSQRCCSSHPTTLLLAHACCGSPCAVNSTSNNAGGAATQAEMDSGDWTTWTERQTGLEGSPADAAATGVATDNLNNQQQQHDPCRCTQSCACHHPASGQCAFRGSAAATHLDHALSPSNASSPSRCPLAPPSLPPTPPTPSCTPSEPLSCLETLDSPIPTHRSHTPSADPPPPTLSPHHPFDAAPNSAYSRSDVQQLIRNEVVRDRALSPSPSCLDQHRITQAMRGMTVSWMAEAVGACSLQRATLFHAVSYLDRFLSTSKDVTVGMLQLVATACLAVASKQVEVMRPSHEEWVLITDRAFSAADLSRMEWLLVTHLSWRLRNPTLLSFMVLYRCGLGAGLAVQVPAVAQYLLELALLQYDMLQFAYPVLAAASLVVAEELLMEADQQLPAPTEAGASPTAASTAAGAGAVGLSAALLGLDPALDAAAVQRATLAVHVLYWEVATGGTAGCGTVGALAAPVQDMYRGHLPELPGRPYH